MFMVRIHLATLNTPLGGDENLMEAKGVTHHEAEHGLNTMEIPNILFPMRMDDLIPECSHG